MYDGLKHKKFSKSRGKEIEWETHRSETGAGEHQLEVTQKLMQILLHIIENTATLICMSEYQRDGTLHYANL